MSVIARDVKIPFSITFAFTINENIIRWSKFTFLSQLPFLKKKFVTAKATGNTPKNVTPMLRYKTCCSCQMTKHHNLFWVALTMKLQPLVELSLILILASYSKGEEEWKVNVNKTINVIRGDNVTIQCNFTYPEKYHTKNVMVHWKIRRESNLKTYDKMNYSIYLYHPNETYVEKKYRGKTIFIGNSTNRNCSLKIVNIMESERNIYIRIIADDKFSFINNPVSIHVFGDTSNTTNQDIDFTTPPTKPTSQPLAGATYAAIFLPVAAALIIIFVIGFFFFRNRREQSLTREDSGYYANFSRASSNQATRKELSKELPELKTFDEPVYINMKAPAGQMDQHMDQSVDHTDNIYANMDYHE